MLLIYAAVIVAITWVLLASSKSTHTRTARRSPLASDPVLDIARERLALGDIDTEQYDRLAQLLTRGVALD